ncbi:MAG: NAD(P)H-dependent glycerol-3-phosphate dehydrogenase [SAR86 cluster bacterium]|uniref:Glycerol-3-phosphate dehydrogenase [NAD(P)+] n=1 Tax=SAR86 cluster bacterium TaxID=2030880 RepID=A0A2A4MI61_9GAMM|nr:MAG: NAD(P)H-dependent glycerol-3-phosphate dehydrogenase [SAR86 cluster bacterium]
MSRRNIAVIGGGSFGTVIANILAMNGCNVHFWMRSETLACQVNELHQNTQYLPDYDLHPRVVASNDMASVVKGCDMVFVAIPSTSFRQVVRQMQPFLEANTILVTTTKGIEADTFLLMSQILEQETTDCLIGVLSGPNLAKEIAAKQLTATVIASVHERVRVQVKNTLKSAYFKVYTSGDMFGVELGGSLKNIYAIIAGIAAAKGMGHNTNSMLVTRSLAEMARFGRELGADPMTFLGLAGVGDLIVTCSTPLSRNYRVGFALGEGKTLEQATLSIGQVVEGVNTVKLVKHRADELNVYMPLTTGLYQVLYEKASIKDLVTSLMLSEQALDVEFAVSHEKNNYD